MTHAAVTKQARTTIEQCAITSAQERLWTETRICLLWQAPAFTHILYSMMDTVGSQHIALFTNDVPIAATDGSSLMLNPETFFKYNLYERVFIVAHEIMHCILNHCEMSYKFNLRGKVPYNDGTELPFDHKTMNISTDLVINDILVESMIGQFNKDWLHDEDKAKHTDSALDVYRKLYKKRPPGGNCFDEHLEPGTSQGKQPSETKRSAQEWQTAVAAAANIAKAQGKLPAGSALAHFFDEVLNPVVPWSDKIQSFFARKIGSGSYDWRRPDRRLVVRDIYAPGRTGHGAGLVIVAVDTSGSITPQVLQQFFAEMVGILEDVRPKRLMVMWIDAAVHAVDEVEEPGDLMNLKPRGGGGTDFRPAFSWVAKENVEPDALVYLTDGYGVFPQAAPTYPVLWGNITPNLSPTRYPFGEVVDVVNG